MPSRPDVVTPSLLREWGLPDAGGSKHSRGHVLVIGGSRPTPGAVLLAGLAALRVGAGVLAMAVAESVAVPLAVAVPESAVVGLPETTSGSVLGRDLDAAADQLQRADALLLGPGLDDPDQTRGLVEALVAAVPDETPVVLDAYAIGVLPQLPDAARALSGRLVLTPNGSEVARLLDRDPGDPLDDAAEIADRYGAVVSAQNAVAAPGGARWSVPAGHAGLGTSGSGDVLSGALTGLLARGVSLERAAAWGTHLHAAAGDRLAARVGRLGFLARELLDEIPLVITELQA